MISIGAFEAKNSFSQLLDRVEKGESVEVTRRGKVVAVLVPPQKSKEDCRKAVEAMRRFRGPSLGKGTVKELIEEGRRF